MSRKENEHRAQPLQSLLEEVRALAGSGSPEKELLTRILPALEEAERNRAEAARLHEQHKTLIETVRYTREELEQKIEEISLVRLVSEMGIRCLLSDNPLQFIIEHVNQITDAEHGSVMLLDRDNGRLYLAASYGPDRIPPYERSFKLGDGIARWVDISLSGEAPGLDPAQVELLRDSDPKYGSFLCYPLIVDRTLVGVLSIGHSRTDAFNENTERILYIIANQVALAVYNSYLLAQHKKQRTVLERSQDHYQSLIERVNDLLELTRLEAGGLKFHKVPIRLRELLTGLRPQYKPDLRRKNLRMQVTMPKRIPTIEADPERLKQALGILIEDAIRSTPPHGSIRLAMTLENLDPERWPQVKLPAKSERFLLFTLSDTAPRIPEQIQGSIFDKLKIEQTQQPMARAARLSLYFAKEIIEAHQGRIWVESGEDVGNTFYFTLPVA